MQNFPKSHYWHRNGISEVGEIQTYHRRTVSFNFVMTLSIPVIYRQHAGITGTPVMWFCISSSDMCSADGGILEVQRSVVAGLTWPC